MQGYVYKLTDVNDQVYIGITTNVNKRYRQHLNGRFSYGIKNFEILEGPVPYETAERLEETYIEKFNSYYDGLNRSIDGKGNHVSKNFTTAGKRFSEESKQKMSISAKARIEKFGPQINDYSQETKSAWSEKRKGVSWGAKKILDEDAIDIYETYKSDNIEFSKDFMMKCVKKSQRHIIENLSFDELRTPGGQVLSKFSLYSRYYAEKHGVNINTIKKILNNKGKRCKSYERQV
jgi:hypothetical protein